MNIDFTEQKTITTSILEVGQLEHSNTCKTCSGNLLELPNATALMVCEKCKRHSLKRNITKKTTTSIVLKQGIELFFFHISIIFI